MKKTTFIFVLFLFTTSFIFSQQATCGFTEYEKRLQQKYPNRKTDAQFEAWLQSKIEISKNKRDINQLITIPVVIHVIHNGDPVGTGKNIGDTQILSQITALNYDMRRTQGTLGYNTNPVGADVEIEFALAKVDPNGNPTNGIDRIKFCNTEIWDPDTIDGILKPQSIWDPSKYLNIWVVNSISPTLGLIGYATFPEGSGLSGITTGIVGTNITDGIIVDYTAFGSNIYTDGSFFLAMPYNTGRILTHEIGHWLGLRHIWGDADCGRRICRCDRSRCCGVRGGGRAARHRADRRAFADDVAHRTGAGALL